jgi:acyl-CoA thioester hydrolase
MNTQEAKYKHREPIQIRFSDVDPLNHVNNSCLFQYYDIGRINYFEAVMGKLNWSEVVVVIVHLEADFKIPILKNDRIVVETRLEKFGNKSMSMQQRIVDVESGLIKSTCKTILSGFDKISSTSILIPEDFKQRFLAFEK